MILKEFTTRISKVKTFLKYARPLKRYSVLKFEFPVILWDLDCYTISSEYRIYSNKRRPRLSAEHGVEKLISAAEFQYFHKMIKIHRNQCNAVLSQQWEFIFINSDVFQFNLSISRSYFIQLSLQNLRVLHFLREGCKLHRYDKPNLN